MSKATKTKSAPSETVYVRYLGPAHVLEVGSRSLDRNGEPVEMARSTYDRLARHPRNQFALARGPRSEAAPPERTEPTPTTETPVSGDQQTG